MPMKLQGTQLTNLKEQEFRQRYITISGQVMQVLGQPNNLQWVQVRPLWEDYFRVNVFIGTDVTSARVAHSYFLETDVNGNILTSTPEITRHY